MNARYRIEHWFERLAQPRNDDRHPGRPAAWGDRAATHHRGRSPGRDRQQRGGGSLNAEPGCLKVVDAARTADRLSRKADGAARRIREEMLALRRRHNVAVEALAIVDHQGTYHWCLHVSGDKTLTMIGLIDIGETRADFPPSPAS